MMEDKKIFQMNSGITLEELVRLLEQYLSIQKHLTTQRFTLGNKIILQCADSDSSWKQFLGLDAALTIELEETNSRLTVAIGNAKWLDKVGAAAAGALFFTPLILAAGVGAVRQAVLPTEIFTFIQGRTEGTASSANSRTTATIFDRPPVPDESAPVTACPCCGNPVNLSQAFCSKCGTKL